MTTNIIVAGQVDVQSLIDRIMNQSAPAIALPSMAFPAARPGERYAGIVLKGDGTPSHHVFALPVPDKRMKQAEAHAWMDTVGSRPTCSEGALVYANLRQHFKKEWHWLGEEFSPGSAWFQTFNGGDQLYGDQRNEFLALAVRRLEI